MLRIHADAAPDGTVRILNHGFEPVPLVKGVKDHHVRIFEHGGQMGLTVGGRKGMDFPSKFFAPQAGFMGRTGAHPVKGFPQQGKTRNMAKPFNASRIRSRRGPEPVSGLARFPRQCLLIHHETGGRNPIQVKP
jgi:hypothetical protein